MVVAQRLIALLDGFEQGDDVLRETGLHLTEELAFAVGVATQVLGVHVGRTAQLHERVQGLGARLHLATRFGLGRDAFDLLRDGGGVFEQGDGVIVALAHLLRAVDAGDTQGVADVHLGEREHLLVEHVVEDAGEIPRHLDMLRLVLAHGNAIRADAQDVGGHQHGIAEQTVADLALGHALVADAVLERGAGLQAAELHDVAEEDSDLADLGHVALTVEGGLVGIDAAGEVVFGHLDGQLIDLGGPGDLGQGVDVGDEEEALAPSRLQIQELLDRPEVVAEVQVAGRAHARQNAVTHGLDPPERDRLVKHTQY